MPDAPQSPPRIAEAPPPPFGDGAGTMPVAPMALGPAARLTLRCRTVAEGRFRQLNYMRDLPPYAVDEPSGLPGADAAPSPSEALLAALGSSLAMGIRARAVARDIIVRRLVLDLEGDTLPIGTTGTSDAGPQPIGFDVIRVTIHLEADAPRDILSELIAHATLASPVANTLYNPVHLDFVLAGT